MDRFRRSSKSSVKSLDSPKNISPPPQPPQPNEWPQHEEELFKEIKNHHKSEQDVTEPAAVEKKFIEDAKKFVDPAEEAYTTPSKIGGEESQTPNPTRPSEEKTSDDQEGKPIQSTPGPGESPEGTPGVGQSKVATSDEGQKKNPENETAKKEKEMDERPVSMLANIIISCTAFALAAALVTFYLVKDAVLAILSNLHQRWDRFTANLIVTPACVNMFYEDVFEPMMKCSNQREPPKKKPEIIITSESGK